MIALATSCSPLAPALEARAEVHFTFSDGKTAAPRPLGLGAAESVRAATPKTIARITLATVIIAASRADATRISRTRRSECSPPRRLLNSPMPAAL